MDVFRYTLVCDGPSDANLIPILNWVLRKSGGLERIRGVRAEFCGLKEKDRPQTLERKLKCALDLYPCRLLFVHRDAERQPPGVRHEEIRRAVGDLAKAKDGTSIPAVAVVPVRMLEAWLLLDEKAIRRAAGNPNGRAPLELPPPSRLEARPDPKEDLRQALSLACGLSGRRLKKFDVRRAFRQIVDYHGDFAVLRKLPAFCQLEKSVSQLAQARYAPGFYGCAA